MKTLLTVFVLLALASCSGAASVGDSCVNDAACPSSTSCVGVDGSSLRLCLAPCDPETRILCQPEDEGSGGVCIELAEGGACFTGGAVEAGSACVQTTDCVPGSLCVIEGGGRRCRVACDLRAPACPAGQSCSSLGSEVRGYCG